MTFYHLTLYFQRVKKSTSIDMFETQGSYFSNITVPFSLTLKNQFYPQIPWTSLKIFYIWVFFNDDDDDDDKNNL